MSFAALIFGDHGKDFVVGLGREETLIGVENFELGGVVQAVCIFGWWS